MRAYVVARFMHRSDRYKAYKKMREVVKQCALNGQGFCKVEKRVGNKKNLMYHRDEHKNRLERGHHGSSPLYHVRPRPSRPAGPARTTRAAFRLVAPPVVDQCCPGERAEDAQRDGTMDS